MSPTCSLNAQRSNRPRTEALDAAAEAQAALQRAQEGLGLPGVRHERDTAGAIPTAVQKDIKRRIATAETELSKLTGNKNSTAEQIDTVRKTIEALNRELDTVFRLADTVVKPTNAPATTARESAKERLQKAKDALEDLEYDPTATEEELRNARDKVARLQALVEPQKVAEGMRLPARKEGAAVRMITGAKKIIEGGMIKLRATGLSQQAANNITIAHYKAQLDDKPDNKKARERYDAATTGMTDGQIIDAINDGNRMLGNGKSLEVIAKYENFRQALVAKEKAAADLADAKKAKDEAMTTLAEDALSIATNESLAAERAYTLARDEYESQHINKKRDSKKQAETDAQIDATFSQEEVADIENADVAESEKSSARKGRVVFRTSRSMGPALHIGAVKRLIGRITEAWVNVPTISLAETLDSLPEHIRQQAIADGVADTFPGVYDPDTNTAYLVADRLHSAEDVISTLAHEISGHFGLRSIMGNDYTRVMNMLYQGNKTVQQKADAKLAENPNLSREGAVEEVLADMAENPNAPVAKGVVARVVAYVKNVLKRLSGQTVSDDYVRQIVANAGRYVTNGGPTGPGGRYVGNAPMFRSKTTSPSLIVGNNKTGALDTLKGNLYGLAGRVQLVDRLSAADEGILRAQSEGVLSSAQAENAQYFMRLADMTTQAAGQFITSGPVKIVGEKIGKETEYRYEAQTGVTLLKAAEHLDAAAKAGLGDDAENIATIIGAGERASALPDGWRRLNSTNPAGVKAEYEAAKARLDANPAAKAAIRAALAEYHDYNKGLLDFLVQTDFMTPEEAARLKKTPYVAYYRVEDGAVKLFTGDEHPVTIGKLADNPDLKQLLGDDQHILPLLTSAVQNTFMLTRAGLKNKGAYETSNALFKAGFASKLGKGTGPANPSTVRFKVKGADHFATIDTDTFGIPAELIVRGMDGIKTTIPAIVKMLGLPANWVRKFVTRGPAYVIRQLVRDPVNAALIGGVDGVPVLNALREMSLMRGGRSPSEDALMRGLVVSSNVYTGDEQDMQKFLRDISTGKGKWDKMLGLMDTMALQADASTRAVAYQDALKKGLTERQAQFRALELQNFSRRGLSPSMQALSVMVPFFNSQIQGLDVLYRSLAGKMPFSDRLEIQRKIAVRGSLLFVGTLAYAAMMQDDDAYKKAKPEERYSNWFVRIPGVKDPLKIPIPYEAGIIFKALPEALVNVAMSDTKRLKPLKVLA